jgi:NADH:ubiquinone oxidoreductase subunit K
MNFTHKKGDTFEAVNFEILVNSVALNLTGATLRMQLRKEFGGVVFLSLTSVASAGITITNAVSGLFKINKQIINIDASNYIYDIELTKADGTVKTYINGNFLISNDITR